MRQPPEPLSRWASRWRRWGCLGIALLLAWGLASCTPEPLLCRSLGDRTLCILRLNRSAKHYWEYRAIVQIDGETQPETVYDCRHRRQIPKQGVPSSFSESGVGSVICGLLN